MVDHSKMKLGKLPPFRDERVRSFAHYLSGELPAPAPISWLGDRADWGMLGNDERGDCTICGPTHFLQVAMANTLRPFDPTTAQALNYYHLIDGFDPANPDATDTGGVISDVLAWIAKNHFYGHALGGYCTVDPQNDLHVDQAIALFGGLVIGAALPVSAQSADVWDLPEGQELTGDWAPGSWGGHCLSLHAFEANGDLIAITWGAQKRITRAWLKAYCDEAYALLWAAWIKEGRAPSGFAYDALKADLAPIRSA